MERFCSRCGSLVEGNGEFCPTCGEKMEAAVAVNLEKPAVNSNPYAANQNIASPVQNNQNLGAQNGNYAAMPNYPQNYNTANTAPAGTMTTGEWVGTIILSMLNIIGLILLFYWAFGGDVNSPRRNFARAMLIVIAIILGLAFVFGALMAAAGVSFLDYMHY